MPPARIVWAMERTHARQNGETGGSAPREGWSLALVTGLICAAAVLFYLFDPATTGGFWVCPFHRITGWACPGCGGQRALHELLHGQIVSALRLNAFAVAVFFPFGVYAYGAYALRVFSGIRLPVPRVAGWPLYLFLASAVLFGVLRNLPGLSL